MRRILKYRDPTICDDAPWQYVRSKSGKLFSVRCFRPPYNSNRYITVLGQKEVAIILKLFAGKAMKYHELGGRIKRALERLIMKKLVIVSDNDDVMLSEGGKSVARVLEKHFSQKRRSRKRI